MSGYRTPALELLVALGAKRIRCTGREIRCSCPLHDDRRRAFCMNVETTKWFCHAGCGSGNGQTLLQRVLSEQHGIEINGKQAFARLQEGKPLEHVPLGALYVRKTNRCSGSFKELEPQMAAVAQWQHQGWKTERIVAELRSSFGIARSTAYTRVDATKQEHFRRPLRRLRHLWKKVLGDLLALLLSHAPAKKSSRALTWDENYGQIASGQGRPKQKRAPPRRTLVGYGARVPFFADVHPLFNPIWGEPKAAAG